MCGQRDLKDVGDGANGKMKSLETIISFRRGDEGLGEMKVNNPQGWYLKQELEDGKENVESGKIRPGGR